MSWLLQSVSDIADLAVVLPIWIVVVAGLLLGRWRRAAMAWFRVIAAVLGLMLLLKLILLGSGTLNWAGIRSPSGHTMSAALLGGGLFGLLTSGRPYPVWMSACVAAAVGAGVGATRVALGVHSVSEVALGLVIGTLGAATLVHLQGPRPHGVRVGPVLLLAASLSVALHGFHLRAEHVISQALRIAAHGSKRS